MTLFCKIFRDWGDSGRVPSPLASVVSDVSHGNSSCQGAVAFTFCGHTHSRMEQNKIRSAICHSKSSLCNNYCSNRLEIKSNISPEVLFRKCNCTSNLHRCTSPLVNRL